MQNIDSKISVKIGNHLLSNDNYGGLNYHKLYNIVDENVDLYLRPIIRDSIAWRVKWNFKNGKYLY